MQGRGYISYYSRYALSSTLSKYITLIAIVLRLSYATVDFYLFYDGAADMPATVVFYLFYDGAADMQI